VINSYFLKYNLIMHYCQHTEIIKIKSQAPSHV